MKPTAEDRVWLEPLKAKGAKKIALFGSLMGGEFSLARIC